MMNVGNREMAFSFGQVLSEGIGFAHLKFVVSNAIWVRPKALLNYDTLDGENNVHVDQRMRGYTSAKEFYINKIADAVAALAACVYPKRIIGEWYEPDKANPMIGFRGCDRYMDPFFEEGFATLPWSLETVEIMIPFVHILDKSGMSMRR